MKRIIALMEEGRILPSALSIEGTEGGRGGCTWGARGV